MGNTPSCGRRVGITQLVYPTRREFTRTTPYQRTVHPPTAELVPKDSGTRLGDASLRLLRDLSENLLHVAQSVYRQPGGSAEPGRPLPISASPSRAGGDPDGPTAPSVATTDRLWRVAAAVPSAWERDPSGPECLRYPQVVDARRRRDAPGGHQTAVSVLPTGSPALLVERARPGEVSQSFHNFAGRAQSESTTSCATTEY
jgi:hypothetical protein